MPAQFTNLLDVAIVLAAVYIALSTISSFINEQIATFLKLRGRKLFLGVANLVTSRTLANAIFNHAAINTTVNDMGGIQDRPTDPNRPSYVEPHNFAVAFWDELANAADGFFPAADRAKKAVDDAAAAAKANPDAAAARVQAASELSSARADATPTGGTGVLTDGAHFEDLRQVVESLPTGELKTNALQLLALAQGKYSKLLSATEAWFDRQMNAVEGWYTRQSRYVAIGLAVGIVFFTGIDTFEVAQRLYTAPAVVSEAAKNILNASNGGTGSAQQTAISTAARDILNSNNFAQFFHPCLGLPVSNPCLIGRNDAYVDEPIVGNVDPKESVCTTKPKTSCLRDASFARDKAQLEMALIADSAAKQAVIDDGDKLKKDGATLRSDWDARDKNKVKDDQDQIAKDVKQVDDDKKRSQDAAVAVTAEQRTLSAYAPTSSHVIGWLITFFAISLGAPFWFDVLNRIVNVRNAGQKPSTH